MRRNFRRQLVPLWSNVRLAQSLWGKLSGFALKQLSELTKKYRFSVATGDLLFFDGRWYVTHAGLLHIAQRRRCTGIRTSAERHLSDSNSNRWVFKATVYRRSAPKGFVRYGDANPSNVSLRVRGAEMRVAETRAVNRAFVKAYGKVVCSVEELGYLSSPPEPVRREGDDHSSHSNGNGSGTGQPRLRDKLCLLIRKYELDPTLVKRYAADFCGTEALRDASRDLVEAFISTLAEEAAKDRAALVYKLNSYNQLAEVKS